MIRHARTAGPPEVSGPSVISVNIAQDVSDLLSANGLIPRGGFNFGPDDETSAGPSCAPARSVLLVGHAGPSIWPHFTRWREQQTADLKNPLDAWSRLVIGDAAARFGARAVFPSDKPWLPFQQWAMRTEGLQASPLGILMHPEYGLWHAYRGALLFDTELPLTPPHNPIHLCEACTGKPCLKACPVGAHSTAGFAYQDCLDHVRSPAGEPCRSGGCFDRNACPHGTAYRYPADQQAFHMAAFAE